MPSSISSSRQNSASWALSWLLTVAICVAVLGAYEFFLNNRGFIPSIENNKNLWSWYRGDIGGNQKKLVFVGASRSQLGINIPYLKDRFGKHNVTQLSINGQYPMATLKALANDQQFSGTAIVSFNAQALESRYLDMQEPRNRYYAEQSSLNKSLDAYLTAWLQTKWRFLHPLLGAQDVVDFYAVNHQFKAVFYTTAHLDQSVSANYSKTDVDALLKHFVKDKQQNYSDDPPTEPKLWAKNIELIKSYGKTIKSKGGQLILVRFPTDKGHWQLDEQYYPREQYWDLIGPGSGVATVHFNDVKGLSEIDLPDSTHVDRKNTLEFTEILFDYLIERGYLN